MMFGMTILSEVDSFIGAKGFFFIAEPPLSLLLTGVAKLLELLSTMCDFDLTSLGTTSFSSSRAFYFFWNSVFSFLMPIDFLFFKTTICSLLGSS